MRRHAHRTVFRLAAAAACLLLAACGPRPGTGRPGELPPEAISSAPFDYGPALAEGTGPHRGEPELDAAALPRDPAALPG